MFMKQKQTHEQGSRVAHPHWNLSFLLESEGIGSTLIFKVSEVYRKTCSLTVLLSAVGGLLRTVSRGLLFHNVSMALPNLEL